MLDCSDDSGNGACVDQCSNCGCILGFISRNGTCTVCYDTITAMDDIASIDVDDIDVNIDEDVDADIIS